MAEYTPVPRVITLRRATLITLKFLHRLPLVTIALLATSGVASAGEIAGLRPPLPAHIERDLDATFVNDFLGRGGGSDDYRTQQSIISISLSERWIANFDHSILTFIEGPLAERTDQVSATLGYELAASHTDQVIQKLIIGGGLRSVDNYGGEKIQNGFHRLVGSTIERLNYTDTRATDATVWFDAERYGLLREPGAGGWFNSWRIGYQLNAASLLTTGGEWDSMLGLRAMLSKPNVDLWLGARSDWRDGYEDTVMQAATQAEEGVAIILGARFGPLVIETVQHLEDGASYGQIRLVSSKDGLPEWQAPGLSVDVSALLPDVEMRLAVRRNTRLLSAESSRWDEALVFGISYGEPQYEDNTRLFYRNLQADAGLEFERPLGGTSRWLTFYGGAGVGWREEQLRGAGFQSGEASPKVGRAILTASTGLRTNVYSDGDRWQARLQFGLLARVPFDDANVDIAGQNIRIHVSTVSLNIGATLDFN